LNIINVTDFCVSLQSAKEENKRNRELLQLESDRQCILTENKTLCYDDDLCYHGNNDKLSNIADNLDVLTLKDKMCHYARERKSREDIFIKTLQTNRERYFDNLLVPAAK